MTIDRRYLAEYHAAVVVDMMRHTGWSMDDAVAVAGAPDDMIDGIDDGLSAADYASEILAAVVS